MTQEIIDNLNKEIADLKNQIEHNKVGVDGLLCQLDAMRATLNEYINANLQTRTQFTMANKQLQEANAKLRSSEEAIARLTVEVDGHVKRISELTSLEAPKPELSKVAVEDEAEAA